MSIQDNKIEAKIEATKRLTRYNIKCIEQAEGVLENLRKSEESIKYIDRKILGYIQLNFDEGNKNDGNMANVLYNEKTKLKQKLSQLSKDLEELDEDSKIIMMEKENFAQKVDEETEVNIKLTSKIEKDSNILDEIKKKMTKVEEIKRKMLELNNQAKFNQAEALVTLQNMSILF
uniref:TACC_C domain-containing protein n=1 Tax=Parastrongyloides trichosuri TaxID=131310 RepID=A0A0N4ZP81_PARTI